MSAILDKLGELAGGQTPEVYVRHQSKLQPTQLGYTPNQIAEWDAFTATRLTIRSSFVESELDAASGELTFPYNDVDAALLWKNKTPEQRTAAMDDLLMLAAEATQQYVLGDLRGQADMRAGLQYSQQAKLYYETAKSTLEAAIRKIENALKTPSAWETTSDQVVHYSASVPIISGW